jgi:tetratricopeptide (TPR) repeat protein
MTTVLASDAPEVTAAPARHRYPGPPPFEDTAGDRLTFRGRAVEIASVTQRVIASRLVVLFGKSGLGKTSLLNAGVFPALRQQALLPVRVRMQPGVRPVPLVLAALREAAASQTTDRTIPETSTLWELFKTATLWHEETLLTPVLVFDQFEEVFTLLTSDERSAVGLELGALVSGAMPDSVRRQQRSLPESQRLSDSPPQVRIVLTIREEHLASLQDLSADVPHLFQDRIRLLPLADDQARQAICEPASLDQAVHSEGVAVEFASTPFEYSDAAIKLILDFLHGRSGHVAPWALQILCMHVEQRVVPAILKKRADARAGEGAPVVVTAADLGGEGELKRVLQAFYKSAIARVPGAQGRRARELCDTGLVSEQGHRLSLERNQIHSEWKVSDQTLARLIDARLLRRESRLESTFYEISHDTLAETIVSTKPFRLPRKWRASAWTLGFVAIVVLGIWIVLTDRIVREKEQAASARGLSDELVAFLISEDLLERLQRSGQMGTLEDVQLNVERYLTAVADGTPTTGSQKAAALALINKGNLASVTGRLEDARVAYEQAIERLHRLQAAGGSDGIVQAGLATVLERAAEIAVDQGRLARARALREEALAVRSRLATLLPDNDAVQRRLAGTLAGLANVMRAQGHLSPALEHAQRGLQVAQGRRNKRPTPEWDYVELDVWDALGSIADQQRDYLVAERSYRRGLEVAARLREILPFEWQAQYQYGLMQYRVANLNPDAIGEIESNPGRTGSDSSQTDGVPTESPRSKTRNASRRAAQRSTSGAEDAKGEMEIRADVYARLHDTVEAMVRWEPRNKRWARELAAVKMWVGWGRKYRGMPEQALNDYRRALQEFIKLSAVDPSNVALRGDVIWANSWLADAIPGPQGLEHIKEAVKIGDSLLAIDPTDRDRVYEHVRYLLQHANREEDEDHPAAAEAAFDRARSLLEELPAPDPTDGEYFDQLIAAHLGRARVRGPRDAKGALEETGRAVKVAQTVSTGNPQSSYFLSQHGRALRLLAKRQEDAGDSAGALKSYQASLASLRQATGLRGRDQERAYAYGEMFLVFFDGLAGLRAQRGDAAGARNAYHESLRAIQKAIGLARDQPVYFENAGLAHRRIGDLLRDDGRTETRAVRNAYARAEQAFRDAARLDNQAAYWNRIFLLYFDSLAPLEAKEDDTAAVRDAYGRAVDMAETAVALAPSDAVYSSNLGLAYQKLGESFLQSEDFEGADKAYAQAEQAFRRARSLEPRTAGYANRLFLLYYSGVAPLRQRQGLTSALPETYRRALSAVDEAIALAPSEAVFHANRYLALERLGDLEDDNSIGALTEYQRALKSIERAAAIAPKDAGHHVSHARVLRTIGLVLNAGADAQRAEAIPHLRLAVEAARRATVLAPKDAGAWNMSAMCRFDLSTISADDNELFRGYQAALDDEERAVELEPATSQYRLNVFAMYRTAVEGLRAIDATAVTAVLRRAIELFEVRLGETASDEDALGLVGVLLAAEEGTTPAAAGQFSGFRDRALQILRSLESGGRLPPEWKLKLSQITRR